MVLTVLGCSGSYPGPGAACSGYLVQADEMNVVIDLGPGTLANLQQHIDLADIDAVVISHCHPDHWSDLSVLMTAWKYGLERTDLPVFGTAETREMAEAVSGELEPTFRWTTIADGSTAVVGPLDIRFSRTDHYVETLAMLVALRSSGTSIAYSADTGPGWSLTTFDHAVDLAVIEATMLVGDEASGVLHLSARQAGEMARLAGAGRLLLTHQTPGSEPAGFEAEGSESFGRPVELAVPHARYEV